MILEFVHALIFISCRIIPRIQGIAFALFTSFFVMITKLTLFLKSVFNHLKYYIAHSFHLITL